MAQVVAVPREVVNEVGPLPAKLDFPVEAKGSKARFLATSLGRFAGPGRFDVVVCGHINLLPLALLAGLRHSAPVFLLVYGVDVWTPPRSRVAARAAAYIHGIVSISRITADRFREWAPIAGKREWILPNAVELDHFITSPRDPRASGSSIATAFAARPCSPRWRGWSPPSA
jgi:hypothetical protein